MISLEHYLLLKDVKQKVKKVVIMGCRPQDSMQIILVTDLVNEIDSHGIVRDGVWKLKATGLPNRWVRLWNGWKSLKNLLTKYSFFDASGCVYNFDPAGILQANASTCSYKMNVSVTNGHLNKRNIFVKLCDARSRRATLVPCHVPLKDVGVAQLSNRSGICWWGSMWFTLCFSPDCSKILKHYVAKSKYPMLLQYVQNVLKSKESSEEFRRFLFFKFGIGDDPDQSPEKDGQNGFAQFSIFCRKLNIPMVTIMAPWMKELSDPITSPVGETVRAPRHPEAGEPAFLGIRTYRSVHVPKFAFRYKGRVWKLRSAMIGSEFCGHQIAISCSCEGQGKWAVYDADGVKESIGPIAWDIAEKGEVNEKRWWQLLDKILPIINQTSGSTYCDMNPHNRHPLESVNRAHVAEMGHSGVQPIDLQTTRYNQVNMDWIYTSD